MGTKETGIVVGRFDPPHLGHSLVIDAARGRVAHLTILVLSSPSDSIPIEERLRMLAEIEPQARICALSAPADPQDMRALAEAVRRVVDARPSLVVSSEPEGSRLARELDAEHFDVDRDRISVPCTSTMIRNAPLDNLRWVAPIVRAHYVRRIAVVGAESTGKTTLAASLGKHFETSWVPEYGREYSLDKHRQGMLGQWRPFEFTHIAREQQRWEDEAARNANRLLFCDTDALATRIWHERYLGYPPETWPIPPSRVALYLLPYPDVPFVADEIRDGEHTRFWMHERFIEELDRAGKSYVVLQGTWEDRLAQAFAASERILRAGTKEQE